MKEYYITKKFRAASLNIIAQANEIISEYEEQGYSLTLRQLYYQFVARGLLENSKRSYDNLGGLINNARLAGMINWLSIEDRTRNLSKRPSWDSPAKIINSCATQFKLDRWLDQETYCEVWIEKEALIGVIENVCNRWDVPFFACRGYTSQSEQWRAGKRLADKFNSFKEIHIFHLGDHDPSGIDMTRDNQVRLSMFAEENVNVHRLALNMDQVTLFNPPPNPTKFTDTRSVEYVQNYGNESWELDALQPSYIEGLIEENITGILDMDIWEETISREEEMKRKILKISKSKILR